MGSNPTPTTNLFLLQGYTVGVAGQTVNLLSFDSGSATLSPCTIFNGEYIMKKNKVIKTRDKIARELWASNQFKQKVIPNKKKIVKKFDYKKEISYYPNIYSLSF